VAPALPPLPVLQGAQQPQAAGDAAAELNNGRARGASMSGPSGIDTARLGATQAASPAAEGRDAAAAGASAPDNGAADTAASQPVGYGDAGAAHAPDHAPGHGPAGPLPPEGAPDGASGAESAQQGGERSEHGEIASAAAYAAAGGDATRPWPSAQAP